MTEPVTHRILVVDDEADITALVAYHLAKAGYRVTTAENFERGLPLGMIYATSRAMLRDRVRSLREANVYERQTYRHVVGLPAILGETEAGLRTETPFLVVRIMRDGRMDLFATGRYVDLLLEEAGALRFRERIVVCDSSRFDTLLAIPL